MSARDRRPSVVVVGGGHGCSRSLAALARLDVERTAVVTVADDGGSSGRLRRDHDVVALGDLRMAMLALADPVDDDVRRDLRSLAGRRFRRGELAGHSLGNLLMLGLVEEHDGDLLAALRRFAALVGARGRVLPATTRPVDLVARTATGTVAGQAAVATTRRIRDVRLVPERPPAAPGVHDALCDADVILLGPGSLYTSILPVLLVEGVEDALASTRARVVLVGNLREQPGETEGMDLADHVDALLQHVPRLRLDVVLAHAPADAVPGARAAPGVTPPLAVDEARIGAIGARVIRAALGDELDGHDPARLADALLVHLLADTSTDTSVVR